jgi:hypothetical protein
MATTNTVCPFGDIRQIGYLTNDIEKRMHHIAFGSRDIDLKGKG